MKTFTQEVHGCHGYERSTGAISQPIYQTATFRHPGFQHSTGYDYSRSSNPTREELEQSLALLEKGEQCWAFSSGMAAIGTVLKLFVPGDHVLLSEDLYGGTVRLCNSIYQRYGIDFEYIDTTDTANVARHLRPATRGIYLETPSNPMMTVSDIAAIARLAHQHNSRLIVDNTFLSPHFQQPLTLGADIVVHSGTKYLCGHNDVVAGFVVAGPGPQRAADRGLIDLIYKSEGASLAPFDSWLMLRSLKTLGLRVERQAQNALVIAQWLEQQPFVTDTYYIGLPGHPAYQLSQKQASGFGAMISFKVTSAELAQKALGRLQLIFFAESLGGVETLLTYPIAQTHQATPPELLARVGLDDRLLRLSVGIEDPADIIQDLQQALS
jgi:cystathionine beta-lyase/cystathionine gamma-synthase